MSYNVSIICSHGHEAWWGNMTSNLSAMWRKAGANLAEFHGKSTSDQRVKLALRKAIQQLEQRPDFYNEMNARNGWGTRENCISFLKAILAKCEEYPDHQITVHR